MISAVLICFRPVGLLVTLWTVACQVPLSMEFSRQEYWSGLPFPSPWDLLNPGIEHRSPALQTNYLLSEPPGKPTMYKISHKDILYSTGNMANIL